MLCLQGQDIFSKTFFRANVIIVIKSYLYITYYGSIECLIKYKKDKTRLHLKCIICENMLKVITYIRDFQIGIL